MNPARIKLLPYVLHTFCIVQTVGLHKTTAAAPTGAERDSNLRCMQRFWQEAILSTTKQLIFALMNS